MKAVNTIADRLEVIREKLIKLEEMPVAWGPEKVNFIDVGFIEGDTIRVDLSKGLTIYVKVDNNGYQTIRYSLSDRHEFLDPANAELTLNSISANLI
ncbi:hypothetical protein DUE52_11140 [Larkinella punicea]|uniref:Uncharacterized protein n=2 Tax=Larkinella punicea TaxID=2315727 RepID=A0A368JP03_9BACT|nr:hypothetical protein DUE52_11140 [Larkinella punicea]